MEDIGEVARILGMQVQRNCEEGTISILQGDYVRTILHKTWRTETMLALHGQGQKST